MIPRKPYLPIAVAFSIALGGVLFAQTASPVTPIGEDHEGKHQRGEMMMKKIDTNGDGIISQQEWTTAGLAADLFQKLDVNKSGSLEATEIQASMKDIHQAFMEKMRMEHGNASGTFQPHHGWGNASGTPPVGGHHGHHEHHGDRGQTPSTSN
ncbi:MAG: hypothetical protein HQM09_06020 [Candidatus Riflebacteria bacterium]|nr:hypothetical protein [Candidatus Riflebacteria bacterium]